MTKGSQNVRAVVLAAGLGKRMKSELPKVLHPVLGKTILGRVLTALDGLNLEHIHIVVGHKADEVQSYLEGNPPNTSWSTHLQMPQLGTGHALSMVAPALATFNGTLLVTCGDTPLLTSETLARLLQSHEAGKAMVSLLTTVVPDAKNYGRIVRDERRQIQRIVEDKDASDKEKQINEINPAIYCFAWPDIKPALTGLKNDNKQGEYYITDIISWAVIEKHRLSSAVAEDWKEVAGINSRIELQEAGRILRDRVITKLSLQSGVTIVDPESTWISPEVTIGADSTVLPGCFLEGDIAVGRNCIVGPHTTMNGVVRVGDGASVIQSLITDSEIGNNCKVGPFAHIRFNSFVGDDSRIGNFVELKKTTVGTKTNVSHLSYVGDAEIGHNANIGAGTITANYDHITKSKNRTVVEDGASTGSNSVLVAPVKIGKEAVVAAGTVVTKDVPSETLAVGRARQENKADWVAYKKRKAAQKV